MIHLVSSENLHRYGPQLDQMFALRERGIFQRDGAPAGSADSEDDERAIYLMDIDEHGDLSGAVRLHPGPGARASWRAARWLVQPSAGDSALARLIIGLQEFCESHALSHVGLDLETALLRQLADWAGGAG